MFHKILIANRGEIACRIAATAHRLGVQTVAVYSSVDAQSRHVAACDQALSIGPAEASESYLRGDKIIAAAIASGAQAIHPGYGFLSENAGFADDCAAAGLIFIGPPASAMRAMGSKSAAKALMEKAGVPLVPGYHGALQDALFLQQQAALIGYPVLLKASAGGGGKGMRIVTQESDFAAALASCKREAANSFGDEQILLEKYLIAPRHVEIQVFADTHGRCVWLFERDCSVQRRHQKVLEEAPAPGMTEARRNAMGEAAVAAARAVDYVGAGTVEFIVDQDGTFYFMEMNTRLQVEHPVTEMITGFDLVEWQLRVACGEALPKAQHELRIHGHAIEARLYAENPASGFLPSLGTLHHLRMPQAVMFAVGAEGSDAQSEPAAVRIDSGVREGDVISPYYDPMLAKLIVWGHDRAQALERMRSALAKVQIVGVSTNIIFLQRLLTSRAFSTADLDTSLIEREQAALFPAPTAAPFAVLALALCALLEAEHNATQDPWAHTSGWRMNTILQRTMTLADGAQANPQTNPQTYAITLDYLATGWRLQHAGLSTDLRYSASGHDLCVTLTDRLSRKLSDPLSDTSSGTLRDASSEEVVRGVVLREDAALHVFYGGEQHVLQILDPLAHAGAAEVEAGRLSAPMPGKIIAILVAPGALVEQGTALLIMEAMKMEHTIYAPTAGVVDALFYAVGDQVAEAAPLLSITAAVRNS